MFKETHNYDKFLTFPQIGEKLVVLHIALKHPFFDKKLMHYASWLSLF